LHLNRVIPAEESGLQDVNFIQPPDVEYQCGFSVLSEYPVYRDEERQRE
jgi:hypothetical protein